MAISAPVLLGTPPATKVSGTTLTQTGVTATEGTMLVVAIAYDNAQGQPTSIKWGQRDLTEYLPVRQANVGTGMTVGIWRLRYVHQPGTRDMVATWSAAILERTMQVIEVTGASRLDVSNSAQQDATLTPATGAIVTTTIADTLHIAAFAAQGPTNDTAATANLGHTLLGRSSTAGVPPVSNVTLQTTYEVLTATGDGRGTLTLTTARDCAGALVTLYSAQTYTVSRAYHQPWNSDIDQNRMVFLVEDETSAEVFPVAVPKVLFDLLTDAQITTYLTAAAGMYASKVYDGGIPVEGVDSDAVTRANTFINDTIAV